MRRQPGLRTGGELRARQHRLRAGWSLAIALLLAASTASAQSTIRERAGHHRPADLSLLLGLPIPFGFGAGMRFGIPVAQEGFIGKINDAVFIEPGFQFVYWSDFDAHQVGFQVPILMRWDFFFTREWTVFGSVGPVLGFWFDDGPGGHGHFQVRGRDVFRPGGPPGFFGIAFGGGAFYNFDPNMSLRLDASTGMLAIGLLFRL